MEKIDFSKRVPEDEIMSEEEIENHFKNNLYLFKPKQHPSTRLINMMGFKCEPKRMLCIGCGTGSDTFHLAMDFPNTEVIGVDASSRCIEYSLMFKKMANELLEKPVDNVKFITLKLPSRELDAKSFDFIHSRSTLHHFANPISFWMSVKYHMTTNGKMFIHDLKRPNNYQEIRQNIERATFMRDMYLKSFQAAYKVEEIEEQLKTAGLDGSVIEEPNHIIVIN